MVTLETRQDRSEIRHFRPLSPLIVVFGRHGAGKDFTTELLAKVYGYYPYFADTDLPQEYKDVLSRGEKPTGQMRLALTRRIIAHTEALKEAHPKVAVDFVFPLDSHRRLFAQAHPEAQFVKVETPEELIRSHFQTNPRPNHPLADVEKTIAIGRGWEAPSFAHDTITNTADKLHIIRQFRRG